MVVAETWDSRGRFGTRSHFKASLTKGAKKYLRVTFLGNPCFDFIHFGKGKIMWGILLLAAAGAGVYFIWQNPKLRNNIKTSISGQSDTSAMDILKKRFAQGEITKEKFEEMRKELEK